jgi:hypoxanthine phosphoribosyltransferase
MKWWAIKAAVQDALSDRKRRRVTEIDLVQYCNELARTVKRGYEPDIVVAIAVGGSRPGELIAKALGIPIVHITIRRDIAIERTYRNDPVPFRWIMSVYHHYLFRTNSPKIVMDASENISGKKALIVDDTVDTGLTVDVAVSHLKGIKVSDMRVATLSHTGRRRPDFCILPTGNYSFPWSRDFCSE